MRGFNLMRALIECCVGDRTAMPATVWHQLRTPRASLNLHAGFVQDSLSFFREDML